MSNIFPNGSTREVLNAVRAEHGSVNFQNTVPELNQDNFKEYATGVLSDPNIMNEWAQHLINRIGLVVQRQRSWTNPLAFLKRGMLEMGETVEEIWTDLVQEKVYKPSTNENDAGKIYASAIPDIYAVFHKVNRQGLYEISFNDTELRKAFVSMGALERFIEGIYNTLEKSDNRDEFLYMKELLKVYADRELFKRVEVTTPTNEQTAKDLIVQIRDYSNRFTFLSREYNAFNVTNHADKDEQIIFISSYLDALIDVNVLASAFNIGKAEFLARRVVLDTMPVENAHVILASRDLFMVYDRLFRITDLYNPKTLEWKYFYHHHQVMSMSRFENAVIFVSETIGVPDTVTVTRATSEDILLGNRTEILAEVKDDTDSKVNVSQAVVWEVDGHTSPDTRMDMNGMLNIGVDEQSETVTVKAFALHYPEIVGELEVTIGETENGTD